MPDREPRPEPNNWDDEAKPDISKSPEADTLGDMVIREVLSLVMVVTLRVEASNIEPEALFSPVISCELPVTSPPRVKALIVNVPDEFCIVSLLTVADSKVADTEASPVILV